MRIPIWIEIREAEAIHERLIAEHGGQDGIRDRNLLESALARPKQLFADGDRPSLAQLAASYAFGIARKHPFIDGNKRVALVVAFAFLELNGWIVNTSQEDTYLHIISLAAGELDEPGCAEWLQRNLEKL